MLIQKKYRGIGEAHPQSLVQVLLRLYKQTQKLVRIVFKVQKKARIYQTKSKQGNFNSEDKLRKKALPMMSTKTYKLRNKYVIVEKQFKTVMDVVHTLQ